jgi:hypothetical protein
LKGRHIETSPVDLEHRGQSRVRFTEKETDNDLSAIFGARSRMRVW